MIPPPRFQSLGVECLVNCQLICPNVDLQEVALPSGHSVLALPVNFRVIALIFAALVIFNCNFPRSMALELDGESLVDPS